jgi:hypothetical protein
VFCNVVKEIQYSSNAFSNIGIGKINNKKNEPSIRANFERVRSLEIDGEDWPGFYSRFLNIRLTSLN